ncbi:MAG: hypothetical protein WC714_18150 [Candidatus Obscuribacterales bacterium]|jgi:hypothetical protein
MLETQCGLFWVFLSGIINSLMLPLMIVAILSAMMGSAGGAMGSILADGIQTISGFVFEIALRLFRLALALFVILAKVLGRGLVSLYRYWKGKQ